MTLTASLDVRAVVGPSTSSWSIPQILCTHWKMTHIAVASRMVTLAKVSSQVHSLVVVESCTYSLVRPQPILHFLSWSRSPRRLVGGYMWARYTIPTLMGLQHIDEPPLTSGTPPSSTFWPAEPLSSVSAVGWFYRRRYNSSCLTRTGAMLERVLDKMRSSWTCQLELDTLNQLMVVGVEGRVRKIQIASADNLQVTGEIEFSRARVLGYDKWWELEKNMRIGDIDAYPGLSTPYSAECQPIKI